MPREAAFQQCHPMETKMRMVDIMISLLHRWRIPTRPVSGNLMLVSTILMKWLGDLKMVPTRLRNLRVQASLTMKTMGSVDAVC
jgi:hypothetical protein